MILMRENIQGRVKGLNPGLDTLRIRGIPFSCDKSHISTSDRETRGCFGLLCFFGSCRIVKVTFMSYNKYCHNILRGSISPVSIDSK